ncbi:histidine--tRNA ligase [bacterium]|nr:histidine--tRNA ligase [bacterium]
MNQNLLSSQPYKGARDFYPEDMRIRNYIFSTWRKVCELYGFDEYDFPILENLEVFASKSGEEIVGTQLFSFVDKGDRKVAIRPELTPSTVRMIAGRYDQLPKPIKWFMIGNNWRFEKPQKGRGREFYQLEANIFGVPEIEADFEIFSMIIDIMSAFGANESMYRIYFSDRRLISALLNDYLQLDDNKQFVARRLMDKRKKVTEQEFALMLTAAGLTKTQAESIEGFMQCKFESLSKIIPSDILATNNGYSNVQKLEKLLKKFDLMKYCEFDPAIIRGFDYSDGLVYEVFDKNPENRRSMFGGERFDRLINIYGKYDLAATGFAMGDITLQEFLIGWNLLPELATKTQVVVTRFPNSTAQLEEYTQKIARDLRKAEITVDLYTTGDKLEKQLKYADKKGIPFVIIAGDDEMQRNVVKLKNLKTKEQKEVTVTDIEKELRN